MAIFRIRVDRVYMVLLFVVELKVSVCFYACVMECNSSRPLEIFCGFSNTFFWRERVGGGGGGGGGFLSKGKIWVASRNHVLRDN